MSDWKVVVPAATVNMVLNPSAEIAGNFVVVGGAPVVTLVSVATHDAFFGIYSYYVQIPALGGPPAQGMRMTLGPLAGVDHYITLRVRDWLGSGYNFTLSLNGAIYHVPVLLETYANWRLYGVVIPAAQAVGSVALDVFNQTGGAIDSLFDGIQVEIGTGRSTYCDGDREGCEWLGLPHGSRSQRSAVSRAGGLIRDLADDLNYEVGAMIATGMAPLDLHVDQYAILPGGQLNSIKVLPNIVSLPGAFMAAADRAGLHAWRQGLINALKPDLVPETEEGAQPVRLRYNGAAVVKEIEAHYLSGLEANIDARFECSEDLAIRLLAPDPFWREIGESAVILDEQDIDTSSYVAGRVNGVWDMFGSPAVAAGAIVRAMVWGPDGNLYIGGSFVNFGPPAADRIAMWNPVTRAWSSLQTGATDNSVRALVFGPDGTLYAGGDFTSMDNGGGPVANTDGIASWDGTNWAPLATGVDNNGVYALAFGQDGFLYAGGSFLLMSGVAGTIRFARWDPIGGAWSAMAAGFDSLVSAIAIAPDGTIYAGGNFNATANYIAYWDPIGAAWQDLGTGANAGVNAIAVDVDGNVYAGGAFTTLDGNAALRFGVWNGTSWVEVGGGFTNTVRALHFAPDGRLYVGGDDITISGGPSPRGILWWDGTAWGHTDYHASGTLDIHAIEIGALDPVVNRNYDIYIGHDIQAANNALFAGNTIVTNNGTTSVFPTFVIERSGVANVQLLMLRNETTGRELLFDYALADEERLTINLAPTEKSVVSSIVGNQPQAVFANSDFGEWSLLPGNNLVTLFAFQSVAPTTATAWLVYRDTYWSQD